MKSSEMRIALWIEGLQGLKICHKEEVITINPKGLIQILEVVLAMVAAVAAVVEV